MKKNNVLTKTMAFVLCAAMVFNSSGFSSLAMEADNAPVVEESVTDQPDVSGGFSADEAKEDDSAEVIYQNDTDEELSDEGISDVEFSEEDVYEVATDEEDVEEETEDVIAAEQVSSVTEESTGKTEPEPVIEEEKVLLKGAVVASGKCGDNLNWTLDDTNTLTISGTGDMYDYDKDEYIDGAQVVPWAKYRYKFKNDPYIQNVVIGKGVTRIGSYAFSHLNEVEEIIIPDGVVSMGCRVFATSVKLNHVVIPGSVMEITRGSSMDESFDGWSWDTISLFSGSNLLKSAGPAGMDKSYNIEYGWRDEIPAHAFEQSYIESIDFPEGLKTIGDSAFYSAYNLKEVILPEGLTTVESGSFSSCYELSHVYIPGSVTKFMTREGGRNISAFNSNNLTSVGPAGSGCSIEYGWTDSIPARAFCSAYQITEITIKPGITSIGDKAFQGTSITDLTIPEGVTTLGMWSFGCYELKHIVVPKSLTKLGGSSFYNTKIKTAGPAGNGFDYEFAWTEELPSGAFAGIEDLEYLQIPGTITRTNANTFSSNKLKTAGPIGGGYNIEFGWTDNIPAYAFQSCLYLEEVFIPNNISIISSAAFRNCWNLKKIRLPMGLAEIGEYAFEACSSLPEIEIPSGTIGYEAFYKCSALKKVTMGEGITSTGRYAFYDCSQLDTVVLPSTLKVIDEASFWECYKLTNINIPDGIEEIRLGAFEECQSLPQIRIPSGVVGDAFVACTSLKEVTLGDDVTELAEMCFKNLKKLEKVTIGKGITSIPYSCFEGCTALTEVIIGDGVTEIGNKAFLGCSSLTTVEFGDMVSTIGECAFQGCAELGSFILWANTKEILKDAFADCDKLTDIYYEGTIYKWDKMTVVNEADMFRNVTIHYDYNPGSTTNDDQNMVRIVKLKCTGLESTYSYSSKSFTINSKNYGSKVQFDIKVVDGATWELYDGPECTEEDIHSHSLSLKTGINTFYVKVVYGEESCIYTFNLIRKVKAKGPQDDGKVYTVKSYSFNTYNNGEAEPLEFEWTFKDFKTGAYAYNHRLAIAGLTLSAAANRSKDGDVGPISEALTDLGFDDDKIRNFNYGIGNTPNNPGISFASKTIDVDGEKKVLIAVVIRGTTTGSDVQTDVKAVKDGFRGAGSNSKKKLENYIKDFYGNKLDFDNTVLFITGHSLGAATAGRLAQEVNDIAYKYDTYVYTYASPNYDLSDSFYDNETQDFNVHTIINVDDSVPNMVVGKERLTYHTVRKWEGINYIHYFINKEMRYNRKDEGETFNIISRNLTGCEKSYDELMDDRRIWHYILFADAYNGLNIADGNTSAAISHAVETYMAFLLLHAPSSAVSSRTMQRIIVECPVDVTVYDSEGNFSGSVTGGEINYPEQTDIIIETDGDKKYILMPYGNNYRIELLGTDTGTMKYSMINTDVVSGDVVEEAVYEDVALTEGKTFVSYIASGEDTDLFVTNQNGEPVKQVEPDGNEVVYSKNGDVADEDIPESGVIPDGLWAVIADGNGVDGGAFNYTGSAIKPAIRVYDNKTLLQEKKDYIIKYANNTKAYSLTEEDAEFNTKKAPSITVTGKGNYNSKDVIYFRILPLDIEGEDFAADDLSMVANNKNQKVAPVLYKKNRILKKGTDYSVAVYRADDISFAQPLGESIKEEGDYKVRLTGKGNYTGTRTIDLSVSAALKQIGKMKFGKVASAGYTGSEITPLVTVTDGSTPLEKDTHYSLSYLYNKEVGTAYVLVSGIPENGYVGTKRIAFKITGVALSKVVFGGIPKTVAFTGDKIDFSEQITANTKASKGAASLPLYKDNDYTVEFQNNTNVGTATVLLTGKGGYTGTVKKTFKITAFEVDKAKDSQGQFEVKCPKTAEYSKGGARPDVTVKFTTASGNKLSLKEGTDFTLKYSNNTTVGGSKTPTVTVTGKGNFKGKRNETFTITTKSLQKASISVQDKVFQPKPGKNFSAVTITDTDGKKLAVGKDYDKKIVYTYPNGAKVQVNGQEIERGINEKVGTKDVIPQGTVIRVMVTAKENGFYTETASETYRITKASISSAKVTVPAQYYTGKKIEPSAATFTVKIKGTVLKPYDDATGEGDFKVIRYENNVKKGTAKVTIQGKGNYGGTCTGTFTIKAKGFRWFWRKES